MTEGAAGIDLAAAVADDIVLKPFERILIPTGIAVKIPHGYEGQVRPRSGLAVKHGITLLNTPGTIDSDYRGEIKLIVINLGSEYFMITNGMRLAQLIISKYERVDIIFKDELDITSRNAGGFGHTGLK